MSARAGRLFVGGIIAVWAVMLAPGVLWLALVVSPVAAVMFACAIPDRWLVRRWRVELFDWSRIPESEDVYPPGSGPYGV